MYTESTLVFHFQGGFCVFCNHITAFFFFSFAERFLYHSQAFFKPFLPFLIISSWGIVRTVESLDQLTRWKPKPSKKQWNYHVLENEMRLWKNWSYKSHQSWNKFLSNEKNGSCWQDYKVFYGIIAASLFYLIMAIYYLFDWCCLTRCGEV